MRSSKVFAAAVVPRQVGAVRQAEGPSPGDLLDGQSDEVLREAREAAGGADAGADASGFVVVEGAAESDGAPAPAPPAPPAPAAPDDAFGSDAPGAAAAGDVTPASVPLQPAAPALLEHASTNAAANGAREANVAARVFIAVA